MKDHQERLSPEEIADKLGLREADIRESIHELGDTKKRGGWIEYMLYILLLVAPLIYYPHIQNFSNLPKATFIQLASCMLVLVWFLKSYRSGKTKVIGHPLMVPLALWLIWSGISIFWAGDKFSGIALWLHWFVCAFCFFVVVHLFNEIGQLDRIVLFSVIGAAMVSAIGILQYTIGLDLIPQGAVPGATFSNKNIAAQFVVMIWPLSFLLFLVNKERRRDWLFAFIHSILVIFILYTKTRAAWVSVLFSLLVFFIFSWISGFWQALKSSLPKGKLFALIASVIFIAGMAFIPQAKPTKKSFKESLVSISRYDKGTARVRLAMWGNSLNLIKDHPLLGVGLANWYVHYPLYHRAKQVDLVFSTKEQPANLHNDPLQLIAETSVVGFFLYVSLFCLMSWRFWMAFRSTGSMEKGPVRLRLVFVMMAMVSFTINSFFSFPLRMAIPPLYLMVILGLLVSLDLNTVKKAKRFVFPVKKSTIYPSIALLSLFVVLLTLFNFRMIFADRHYLGSSYFNRVKNWRFARAAAQKAADYIPWRYQIWFELGKAADHLGLDDEALEAYIRALEVHPNHINSLLNLGHVHLKKGDYDRAAQHTLKAVNIKPDFDMALFNMALMNDRQGRIKEALEYYQRAIKANPTYAEAYFGLGILFLKRERLSESRHHLERAIELKPHMMGVHFNLGLVYDRLKKPEKAIVEYKKEIELNPKSAEAYTNLGLISAKEKEWREAISLYQRAICINPDLGAAHVNMAVAYYVLRNYDSAWKHTRIAERLGLPQAKILIRRLSKISKEPE